MTLRRIAGTISLRPIAFARTGLELVDEDTGKRRRLNPARYRNWKDAAALLAIQHRARAGGRPLEGPLGIDIVVGPDGIAYEVFELGATSRPGRLQGDLDNYVKALLDALQGVAYSDDKAIQRITAHLTLDLEEEDPVA